MRVGIDLGGTKIEAVLLDADGSERARRRVPTPHDDYEATLRAVGELVAALDAEAGTAASVGIGMPGSLSPLTGLVRNSNSTCLNHRPFHQDIERTLRRPVRLANDANCFALSEATDGAAAGGKVVFGVILGTGVGGGLVVDGKLVVGRNLVAGEWGHNPLPAPEDDERPGPRCYCGRLGCIEAFLSGPAFARDHREATGEEREAAAIAEAAEAGDAAADATLSRYERRFARALGSIVNVADPDAIVLGGGMSNIDRLYETVPKLWGPHVFSDVVETRLVKAKHGDASGVRGAAWLWD